MLRIISFSVQEWLYNIICLTKLMLIPSSKMDVRSIMSFLISSNDNKPFIIGGYSNLASGLQFNWKNSSSISRKLPQFTSE